MSQGFRNLKYFKLLPAGKVPILYKVSYMYIYAIHFMIKG